VQQWNKLPVTKSLNKNMQTVTLGHKETKSEERTWKKGKTEICPAARAQNGSPAQRAQRVAQEEHAQLRR
jgi:hypothetical protein